MPHKWSGMLRQGDRWEERRGTEAQRQSKGAELQSHRAYEVRSPAPWYWKVELGLPLAQHVGSSNHLCCITLVFGKT